MRTRVAMLVAAFALVAAPAAAGRSAAPSRSALAPTAVTFADRLHGELGLASPNCDGCNPRGAIAVTADGGKTWRVVRHTERPVVAIAYFHDVYYAELDNGRLIPDQPGSRDVFKGYCPNGWTRGYSADIVDTNVDTPWSICSGQPAAGNEAKAVYRGTKRVALTPTALHRGYGGISEYGYAAGIAGDGRFGIIWETRGTLYVTLDGGRRWHPLPDLARPELDFGSWAYVLNSRVGFVILERNGHRRLIETRDAGRKWRVVHRWKP
jgi:hypothetical protein